MKLKENFPGCVEVENGTKFPFHAAMNYSFQ